MRRWLPFRLENPWRAKRLRLGWWFLGVAISWWPYPTFLVALPLVGSVHLAVRPSRVLVYEGARVPQLWMVSASFDPFWHPSRWLTWRLQASVPKRNPRARFLFRVPR